MAHTPYRTAPFWTAALCVLILSLIPSPESLPSTEWDKSNHLLAFALLAFLGLNAYRGKPQWVYGGLFLFGCMIEVLQSLTTYRSAEWLDIVADTLGLLIALVLIKTIKPIRRHFS